MTVNLSICIAHAAHRPERKDTLRRLMSSIELGPGDSLAIEDRPGTPREYLDRQWEKALAGDDTKPTPTHVVLLNDDVVPCENFIETLRAAIAARPGEIIALTNHHEDAAPQAKKRDLRWLVTADMLVGQAYVVPRGTLIEALSWGQKHLKWERRDLDPNHRLYLSEEHILITYALCHDRRIWHTIPALVDHAPEHEAPSLFGHAGDWARRVIVPPRTPMPTDWDTDAVVVGSFVPNAMRHMLASVKPEYWQELQVAERYYGVDRG